MNLRRRWWSYKFEPRVERVLKIALVVYFLCAMLLNFAVPRPGGPWRGPKLLAPIGREKWEIGATKVIVWEAYRKTMFGGWKSDGGKRAVPVVIRLSRDGGENWEDIADLSQLDAPVRALAWKVSGPASTECRMRIDDVRGGGAFASKTFQIAAPGAGGAASRTPRPGR